MKYEFTKDYLTGIDEIDAEHQKLFDLTNECYELVMESAAEDKYDQIVGLLGELRAYAATPLATGISTCASYKKSTASISMPSTRTSRKNC